MVCVHYLEITKKPDKMILTQGPISRLFWSFHANLTVFISEWRLLSCSVITFADEDCEMWLKVHIKASKWTKMKNFILKKKQDKNEKIHCSHVISLIRQGGLTLTLFLIYYINYTLNYMLHIC